MTNLKMMAGKSPTFPLTVTVHNVDGDEFNIVFTVKSKKRAHG